MLTDILDRNIAKIMTLFSISPGSKFSRNEIKGKTMLHNLPLDTSLATLTKNRILTREKRLFGVNFESDNAKHLLDSMKKEHARLRETPLNIYCMLIDISESFSKFRQINNIHLFGSYSKLVYTEKSDLDLAIIVQKEDKMLAEQITSEIRKIEKKYGKPVQAHFFESKDMEANDPLIKEIKKNGIALF